MSPESPDWCACEKATKADVWSAALMLTVVINLVPAIAYLRDAANGSLVTSVAPFVVGAFLLLVICLVYAGKGAAAISSPDSAACHKATKGVCFSAVALTVAVNAVPAFLCAKDRAAGSHLWWAFLSVEPLVVGSILLLALGVYVNKKRTAPLSVSAPTTRAQHRQLSESSPTSIMPHFEAPPDIEKLPAAFTRRSKSPMRY